MAIDDLIAVCGLSFMAGALVAVIFLCWER